MINIAIALRIKLVAAAAAALMLKLMRALYMCRQTVPYSNRKHLILIPECWEQHFGKWALDSVKVCIPDRERASLRALAELFSGAMANAQECSTA